MFKYSHDADRFMPDRTEYSFFAVHEPLNHKCDVSLDNTDFLEPFECQRLKKQRHRAFRQLLSYMLPETGAGGRQWNARDKRRLVTADAVDGRAAWPVCMVRERSLARKSYFASKHTTADILLDMPNLSSDWKAKILDWSATGYLTAGIDSSMHLWSGRTQSVQYTIGVVADEPNGSAKTTIGCLKWDEQGEKLAYSFVTDGCLSSESESSSSSSSLSSLSVFSAYSNDRATTIGGGRPSSSSEHDGRHRGGLPGTAAADPSSTKRTECNNYIKVWSLNKQKDDRYSDNETTASSTCGCVTLNGPVECCVIVMDWLANGHVLVTGCSSATVTFFKYDRRRQRLVTLRVIRVDEQGSGRSAFVSCLHASLDKFNRHLAAATYSRHASVLRVWRIEDPPGVFPCPDVRYDDPVTCVRVTEALVDRYEAGERDKPKRVIKAFAWHPWKHSVMCYAVSSNVPNSSLADVSHPSWLVLANACTGQVLARVEQTACNTCPSTTTLSVDVHAMTFSRITGELLVSTSTAYKVWKDPNSNPRPVIKHSVVVMHALDEIVETLNTNNTEKGLFFTWSPDGSRLALTSTDESLRIWNFFPTTVARKKPDGRADAANSVSANTSVQPADIGFLSNGRERIKRDIWYRNNRLIASELSMAASRVTR